MRGSTAGNAIAVRPGSLPRSDRHTSTVAAMTASSADASSAALRALNTRSPMPGRAPFVERPRDQLDERVQRAHVCRAVLVSAWRLRSPESPPLRRRSRLTASLPSASAASSAVPSTPPSRLYRTAVNAPSGWLSERHDSDADADLPFSAIVSGVTTLTAQSSCHAGCRTAGGGDLSFGRRRIAIDLFMTDGTRQRDRARKAQRRRRAAGKLAVPARRSTRRTARHQARAKLRAARRPATSAAAASPPSHAASPPRARPASPPSARPARTPRPRESTADSSGTDARRRRRTYRPACRGYRPCPQARATAREWAPATSEYCASRPCSAAPPCSEFCTR